MKKTIKIALILGLAIVLMTGCGKTKKKPGPTGPVIPSIGTILWNFETSEEVEKFDNDGTDATLEYNTAIFAEGNGAIKVTPSGTAPETKIAAELDSAKINAWNQSRNLVLDLYMEQGMDPAINIVFLGIADVTGGSWSWVDGTFCSIAGSKMGNWNKCILDLSEKPTMVNLDPKRTYKFYFGFYNEVEGEKIPLADSSSFFVDQIYIDGVGSNGGDPGDPGDEPGEPQLLWGFETESEVEGFAEDGGTGAVLDHTTEEAYQGTGALKVTPNGTAAETKIKVQLPMAHNEAWSDRSQVVVNLWMEAGMDPAINKIFFGMADVTDGGWEWVDGTTYTITEPKLGEWNECEITLPAPMLNLEPTKQYELYFGFFNEDGGSKTPLADAFYLDHITVE